MELNVEYWDVNDLQVYENNARHHEATDVDAIANSISQFGFNDPIAVWKHVMEKDPHYCDVIIERWEKLTGRKAVLSNEEADLEK